MLIKIDRADRESFRFDSSKPAEMEAVIRQKNVQLQVSIFHFYKEADLSHMFLSTFFDYEPGLYFQLIIFCLISTLHTGHCLP